MTDKPYEWRPVIQAYGIKAAECVACKRIQFYHVDNCTPTPGPKGWIKSLFGDHLTCGECVPRVTK